MAPNTRHATDAARRDVVYASARRLPAPGKAAGAQSTAKALPMRAFSDSLPMVLLRTREAVMRRFRPPLRDHGVTEQQWRVLRALAGRESMDAKDLAAATCLLASSLSRILPDLEARGLVRRSQRSSDLRCCVLSLEPAGLKLIAAHAPCAERIYSDIERRFGAERTRQLFQLLRDLECTLAESKP